MAEYEDRMRSEQAAYETCEVVHDLPPIYHYWSATYLQPMGRAIGIDDATDLFVRDLVQCAKNRRGSGPARFVSIGAGNCDFEAALARTLVERGISEFVIECMDINRAMLTRGLEHAQREGVERQIEPLEADFNAWQPDGLYDGVIANQSLHHVLELEGLFDAIGASMTDEALFIASDMIGRNGHQRWPEARAIVEEFWDELPPSYRYHNQLQRQEDEFMDWDCSQEGFEGIRSQDVLPLLVERFRFTRFLGFANVVDPFIDRGFGPNFDADHPFDRRFIDRVHRRDMRGLLSGELKPTHMLATMRRPWTRTSKGPLVYRALTPEFSIRHP